MPPERLERRDTVTAGPGYRAESDALEREIDAGLASLRATQPDADLQIAERIADELRRLVGQTARASAADRARVCAAVRYFASRAFASALMSPGSTHSAAIRSRGRALPGSRTAILINFQTPRRPVRPMRADIRVVGDILHGLASSDLIPTA
jgi:hypothetical protein